MMEILDRNIKDLINQYPSMGKALDDFNIACTTCNVGTCKLKDIVEIHNLSEIDERALFMKIAGIVYPGKTVEIPHLPRKAAAAGAKKKFSPPMQMLVDEHKHIKRVIAAIPDLVESVKSSLPENRKTVEQVIDFIRNYADRFHHAKEEDILFKQFEPATDIIKVMLEEHKIGRGHVKEVLAGLELNDANRIAANLSAYGALLTEHIFKEDEILYPWMERNMSDSQIGRLYSDFLSVEESFDGSPQRLVAFAESLTLNKIQEVL